MKKTLLIVTHHPLPEASGSSMRTMHFVRFFAKLGPVDLAYSFGQPPQDGQESPFRSEIRIDFREEERFARRFVNGVVRRRPMPVYSYTEETIDRLRALFRAESYDYVLVRSVYPSGALFDLPKEARPRTIFDLDDSLSDSLYEHFLTGVSGPRRWLLDLNRVLLRRHEARSAARAGVCLICNLSDTEKMTTSSGHPPVLVPNVFSPTRSRASTSATLGFENPDELLFVGTLSYRPNEEGLRWFMASILPRFLLEYPEATLTVVGRSPSSDLAALCDATPGVKLHADVDDVLAYYSRCRAVVVPLRAGGGTRVKILESVFAERPVIATSVGADGLEFRDGRELLLFETAEQFVEAYGRLSSKPIYDGLVDSARLVFDERYSPDVFDGIMTSVLSRMDR